MHSAYVASRKSDGSLMVRVEVKDDRVLIG